MTGKRVIGVVFAAAILSAALWCYREYTSEVTSLNTARQALIRVDSGVQYHSVMNLRSKIADADAAVTTFRLHRHVFLRSYQLDSAKRGLTYLDIALDDAKAIRDWRDMDAYLDVTAFAAFGPRVCSEGHLLFWPAMVVQPFMEIGRDLVRKAVGESPLLAPNGAVPVLDYAKESAACVQAQEVEIREADARKAADEARKQADEAKWKYHVQISNPDGCGFAPYQDGNRGPRSNAIAFYFHANDSVGLVDAVCVHGERNPASHLAVTINGKRIDVDWHNQDKWYYEAMPIWGEKP
jgi:hypothetical protein